MLNQPTYLLHNFSVQFLMVVNCATTDGDVKAASQPQQGQVRAGHVTKGYHQLQQEDSLQPPTSDSDRGSRSGSASELDLDSDISKHSPSLAYLLFLTPAATESRARK